MKDFVMLMLRLALGISFLSAVADRLGFWGPPGSALVGWGDWENFLIYTHTLTFGISTGISDFLGWAATILEALFGVLLIIGFKVKITAFLSGLLLLGFGIAMAFNTHIKFALDYSVFSACFGAFLLALQPIGKWGLDWIKHKPSHF